MWMAADIHREQASLLGWEAGEIQTSSDKQFPSSWVVFLEAASIQGVGELLWLGKMQRTVGQHPKWVVLCPLQLLAGLGWAEHFWSSFPWRSGSLSLETCYFYRY